MPFTLQQKRRLMRAYAQGDPHAFERLYSRHHAALYRFVRRLLGREAGTQADEVFQDTWLRIVTARDKFVPQGAAWRTWRAATVGSSVVQACDGVPVASATSWR